MVAKSEMKKTDLDRLPIVGQQPTSEKEEKHLREIGEYEFYNLEETGLSLKFPYGNTQNKINFTFFHGGKYRIPRHVARHVESRSTPRWEWRPDGTGQLTKIRVGDKPRFQMRPVF